jgi:hypothetical protein
MAICIDPVSIEASLALSRKVRDRPDWMHEVTHGDAPGKAGQRHHGCTDDRISRVR